MGKVVCPWDTLINFVTDAFVGYGIPREEAEICTDILLESDRRGIESHGCNRFKPIYLDRIKAGIQNPITNFEIVKETPCTAVVDGHDGMGQVIGYKSMQMAIDKAKQYGFTMRLKNGQKLTCAGDEPLNEKCFGYAEGSDWLMHEAFCLYSQRDQYDPYEKHHSTVREACELAAYLNVPNLT